MAKVSLLSVLADHKGTKDSGAVALTVKDIMLDEISIKDNVRKEYTGIDELAISIREHGLIQPITVYKHNEEGYIIKAGHRRYLAWKSLYEENPDRYHSIRCIISDDQNILMVQLIENIQREGLAPLDQYHGLKTLKDSGMTLKQIAAVLGKTEGSIKNLFMGVNVINADNDYENLLGHAGVTIESFKETVAIKNKDEKIQAITDIASGKIKRKDLRKIVKDKKPAKQKKRSDAKSTTVELHIDKDKLTVKWGFDDAKIRRLVVDDFKVVLEKNNIKIIKAIHT